MALHCTIKLHADDANLYCSYKLDEYSPALVKAVEYLVELSKVWQLHIVSVLHTKSLHYMSQQLICVTMQ